MVSFSSCFGSVVFNVPIGIEFWFFDFVENSKCQRFEVKNKEKSL